MAVEFGSTWCTTGLWGGSPREDGEEDVGGYDPVVEEGRRMGGCLAATGEDGGED